MEADRANQVEWKVVLPRRVMETALPPTAYLLSIAWIFGCVDSPVRVFIPSEVESPNSCVADSVTA